MNKIYNEQGSLIGYALGGINTRSKIELFRIYCGIVWIKLSALGVSEQGIEKYFVETLKHYGMEQGLDIRDGIPYFSNTDEPWIYKPVSCEGIFFNCSADSLNLEVLDTSNVIDMSSMFFYSRLSDLNFSFFDTSNVINMSYMFQYCKIQSLDLRSFNTSKVTEMSSMFADCLVESLDISSFDIKETTAIDRMFTRSNIQHIKINQQAFDKILSTFEVFDAKVMTSDRFRNICEII